MSIKIMSLVWDCHELTKQSEMLVMLALADHSNDQGHCWPSMARIAYKARLQARQVQRVIRSLKKRGFLQIEERPGITNRYVLILKEGGVNMTPPTETPTENVMGGVSQLRRGGGVTAMTPESSITINNHQKTVYTEPEERREERKPEDLQHVEKCLSRMKRSVGKRG